MLANVFDAATFSSTTSIQNVIPSACPKTIQFIQGFRRNVKNMLGPELLPELVVLLVSEYNFT